MQCCSTEVRRIDSDVVSFLPATDQMEQGFTALQTLYGTLLSSLKFFFFFWDFHQLHFKATIEMGAGIVGNAVFVLKHTTPYNYQ